jgi:hypothetical protein
LRHGNTDNSCVELCQRMLYMLLVLVGVPGHHLKRLVPRHSLNRGEINARLNQMRDGRMAQGVARNVTIR